MNKPIVLMAGAAVFVLCRAAAQSTDPIPAEAAAKPVPAAAQPAGLDELDPAHSLSLVKLESMSQFQTDTITKILGVSLHVDGVIPQIRQTGNPLQWVNPLAPADYGNGLQNVSVDPLTRRMQGISFLTFHF